MRRASVALVLGAARPLRFAVRAARKPWVAIALRNPCYAQALGDHPWSPARRVRLAPGHPCDACVAPPSRVQLGQTAELVCHAEAAEAPLPAPVVLECGAKSPLIEVRPKAIAEMEFRERAFPEQKVAEPSLASGANQQVDLGCGISAMINFMQQAVKVLRRQIRVAPGAPRGLHDAVLRGVVDGNSQEHARARRARPLALLDGPEQVLAEPVAPS